MFRTEFSGGSLRRAAGGRRRVGGAFALVTWMMAAAGGVAMCGEPATNRLEPDARVQGAIEEAVSAIVRNDDAAAERFASLQRLRDKDRAALLLQLALYLESAEGNDRGMAGAIVLQRLAFTPKETIEAVAPRLEDAGPSRRRVFTGMLAAVDRRDGGEADFRVYDAWLTGRAGRPPASFVAYVYDAAPDEAVQLMQRVYGRATPLQTGSKQSLDDMKSIVAGRDVSRSLTSQERSRAASALATLASDPAWWVRRYAAAVLRDETALAPPAVIEKLTGDPDALVREGLAASP